MSINFETIFENFKCPFITRQQLQNITEGLINAKTLRNIDCLGKGIKGKINIGTRKVAYPVNEVIAWLNNKTKEGANDKKL